MTFIQQQNEGTGEKKESEETKKERKEGRTERERKLHIKKDHVGINPTKS